MDLYSLFLLLCIIALGALITSIILHMIFTRRKVYLSRFQEIFHDSQVKGWNIPSVQGRYRGKNVEISLTGGGKYCNPQIHIQVDIPYIFHLVIHEKRGTVASLKDDITMLPSTWLGNELSLYSEDRELARAFFEKR